MIFRRMDRLIMFRTPQNREYQLRRYSFDRWWQLCVMFYSENQRPLSGKLTSAAGQIQPPAAKAPVHRDNAQQYNGADNCTYFNLCVRDKSHKPFLGRAHTQRRFF